MGIQTNNRRSESIRSSSSKSIHRKIELQWKRWLGSRTARLDFRGGLLSFDDRLPRDKAHPRTSLHSIWADLGVGTVFDYHPNKFHLT